MRQASWEEFFKSAGSCAEEPEVKKPAWWRKLAVFSWEELVTLVIVFIGFMTVVQSIDSADWVAEMPSLYPIALPRPGRWGSCLAQTPLQRAGRAPASALAVGAGGVAVQRRRQTWQGSVPDRVAELVRPDAALGRTPLTSGGISNDNLPFVVLVVALTFLTAYMSAWSIFRWYNAWLGLIPGGLALLTNISYLPGQKSLRADDLPVLRRSCWWRACNLLRQAREWQRERHALPGPDQPARAQRHGLGGAWAAGVRLGPAGGQRQRAAVRGCGRRSTAPVAGPFQDLGRVFSSIDSKKGGVVHQLRRDAAAAGRDHAGRRRGDARSRRRRPASCGPRATTSTRRRAGRSALERPDHAGGLAGAARRSRARRRRGASSGAPSSVQVTTSKKQGVIVSAGQPLAVNVDSRVVFGADPSDVTSVRPTAHAQQRARSTASTARVSNASVAGLRQARPTYPAWIAGLPAAAGRPAATRRATRRGRSRRAPTTPTTRRPRSSSTCAPSRSTRRSTPAPPKQATRWTTSCSTSQARLLRLSRLGDGGDAALAGHPGAHRGRLRDPAAGPACRILNVYIVAEANAFAWPEVYFPGLGWVEFNPTPSEPRDRALGSDDQDLFRGRRPDVVPEDELLPDEPVPRRAAAAPDALDALAIDGGSSLVGNHPDGHGPGVPGHRPWPAGSPSNSPGSAASAGLDYPSQIWEKTQRLARWARIPAFPQQTPREYVGAPRARACRRSKTSTTWARPTCARATAPRPSSRRSGSA